MRRWRRGVMTLLVPALIGCTGGGGKPPSPTPSVPTVLPTVLPSADRIRLGQTRLGGPAACVDDEYCAAGLTRVYAIDLGDRIVSLADPAATVGALQAGAIDVGVIPRSALDRVTSQVAPLIDDRRLAPAANPVPILTAATAPTISPALDAISARLDQAGIDAIERSLADGSTPEQAATAWLGEHGYIHSYPPPAPGALEAVIGATADPENAALATIYASGLAASGFPTRVAPLDGGRADMVDALSGGRINIGVDGAGPLLEYLAGFSAVATASVAHTSALLRARLAPLGLVAGAPAPGAPGMTFVVSRAVSASLGLSTLSDLSRASGARLPAPTTTTSLVASTTSTTTSTVPVSVPAGATAFHPGAPLGIGAAGTAVIALQQQLIALGYAHLLTTGVFDEATRREVVAFQSDAGLIDTGVADAVTQQALAGGHPTGDAAVAPAPGDVDSIRPPPGTGAGNVYLVFAGGPSPATSQVLTELNRRSARATFLSDDTTIRRHADIARTVRTPNAVGFSAAPHDATSPVAEDVLWRTIARARDDLAGVVGPTSSCVLAPYGATDPATRRNAADRGLKTVLWDIDPQDWRRPGTDVIAADVIDNVHAGSIVLLHDGGGDRSQTVAALATILDVLAARGYTFAAIPDCLAAGG